jgi:diguanylate cyclase (GGDEF)-like protein
MALVSTPTHAPKDDHDAAPIWRVMIVDADAEVHASAMSALTNVTLHGRALQFDHAYGAAKARDLLATLLVNERDLAVILIGVVADQPDDAGLHLVRHVREQLGMRDVRIILRTGQSDDAPDLDAMEHYDIHAYCTTAEFDRGRLVTTVTAALRAFEQLCAVKASRRALDRVVTASAELMALHGLADFGAGVLAQAAGILGIDAHGLLCAQGNEPGAALTVVARAGRLINADADAAALDAMERALIQRRNIYADEYIVLYFAGKASRVFVAWLALERRQSTFEQRLLELYCANVAVGLGNVELVSHLHDAAFYDQLSKLPNRTRLIDLLNTTLAGPHRQHAILALVDLDHFAETNDALGHQFGDLLLVSVGARLKAQLGQQQSVARIGGDLFCVLGPTDAVNPQRILSLFEAPFSIDGQDVQVSATLGLVRLAEHDGSGADALKDADIALKRAKSQQRAGHFYFSRSMGIEIRERVRIMHAMRTGFSRGEMYLVYQPQIDLVTRLPIGAEALLRWHTADGQFISPDRFIPIAEYSGLIIDIGEWVLRSACFELVRLRQAGYDEFTMSVNVSQVQFRHPYFLDMLRAALAETRAPPEFIELEITESMAMEEPDLLIKMLAQVKQTGVKIAIDDFGTGFSSLSYLQRLQVDRLKIDRAFVTEITSSARGSSIAEMVIQLGRNLGLTVIAEGVEDERQAHVLQALGCPLAQGFLFAKPMATTGLYDWLRDDARSRQL